MCNDKWMGERRLMEAVLCMPNDCQERPRSPQRYELGSNTITAALHISDGLDDYQPNVIMDLRMRKIGVCAVWCRTACVCP